MYSESQISEIWVDDILTRYRQQVGNLELPIDEKELIIAVEHSKGIKIDIEEKENPCALKSEGFLIPKRGGFTLHYYTKPRKAGIALFNILARTRFTICHELAHIYFYDCNHTIPRLTATHQEYMCHKIARNMLLPKETVIKKFYEQYNLGDNYIFFLRKFSKDAKVGLLPLAWRLTEDLSLVKDAMITFWFYKNKGCEREKKDKAISFEDYQLHTRSCLQLKKLLPKYWREQIYRRSWEAIVKKVAISGNSCLSKSLRIEGLQKKEGKVKNIVFDIECETLRDLSVQKSLLIWLNKSPIYDLLSVYRFYL